MHSGQKIKVLEIIITIVSRGACLFARPSDLTWSQNKFGDAGDLHLEIISEAILLTWYSCDDKDN